MRFKAPPSSSRPAFISSLNWPHWWPSTRSSYCVPAMPCAMERRRMRTMSTILAMTSASVRLPRAISYSTASFHSGVLRPASWRSISSQVVKGTRVSLRERTGSTGDKSFDGANRESPVSSAIVCSLTNCAAFTSTSCSPAASCSRMASADTSVASSCASLWPSPRTHSRVSKQSPNMETVKPSTLMHLHHAAAGGDGAQEVLLLPVAQREAVGVRVRIAGVHGLDADAARPDRAAPAANRAVARRRRPSPSSRRTGPCPNLACRAWSAASRCGRTRPAPR